MNLFFSLATRTVTDKQNPPLTSFAAPFVKGGRRFSGGGI